MAWDEVLERAEQRRRTAAEWCDWQRTHETGVLTGWRPGA